MVNLNIPPELQQQAKRLWAAAGPVAVQIGRQLSALMSAGRAPTVSSTFRHICVVGLNRSELLLAGENSPVFGDTWQDLADDNLKRNLGLIFFAPRGLDGEPVNPYLFLAGDAVANADMVDANTLGLAQQMMGSMGLLDFCRMPAASPNTVNILLAGDVLFHWDVKDNYVLPTTPTSWTRDIEQIIKGYPRTTKAVIYTNWDTDILPKTDRITILPLSELPVPDEVWLNKPTTQEKYGNHILAIALLVASATAGLLHLQGRGIDDVNEQLRIVEQQIPREGRFTELARAVSEQEKLMQKREMFYLAVKDSARAITSADIKFANFEVKAPDPQEPPTEYIVTIEAEKGVYQGWLQEEPVAKNLLMGSALMAAVRKPPSANAFKIEGLIPLEASWREYKKLMRPLSPSRATAAATTSPTLAETSGASAEASESQNEGGAAR